MTLSFFEPAIPLESSLNALFEQRDFWDFRCASYNNVAYFLGLPIAFENGEYSDCCDYLNAIQHRRLAVGPQITDQPKSDAELRDKKWMNAKKVDKEGIGQLVTRACLAECDQNFLNRMYAIFFLNRGRRDLTQVALPDSLVEYGLKIQQRLAIAEAQRVYECYLLQAFSSKIKGSNAPSYTTKQYVDERAQLMANNNHELSLRNTIKSSILMSTMVLLPIIEFPLRIFFSKDVCYKGVQYLLVDCAVFLTALVVGVLAGLVAYGVKKIMSNSTGKKLAALDKAHAGSVECQLAKQKMDALVGDTRKTPAHHTTKEQISNIAVTNGAAGEPLLSPSHVHNL